MAGAAFRVEAGDRGAFVPRSLLDAVCTVDEADPPRVAGGSSDTGFVGGATAASAEAAGIEAPTTGWTVGLGGTGAGAELTCGGIPTVSTMGMAPKGSGA
jgi:hypothetical protein